MYKVKLDINSWNYSNLIVFRLSFRIKKVLKGKSYDLEPDPQKGRAEPGMQKALLIKSQISITKIIVK